MSTPMFFDALVWATALISLIAGTKWPRSRLARIRWLTAGLLFLAAGHVVVGAGVEHRWIDDRLALKIVAFATVMFIFCAVMQLVSGLRQLRSPTRRPGPDHQI